MDPGWMFICMFLFGEVAVILTLIMPMPSNRIRQFTIGTLREVWNKYPYLRHMSFVIMLLDLYFLYTSVTFIYADHAFMDQTQYRIRLFREQRNAYLTGFGLFLFFVLTRLMDLHTQLYHAREAQKLSESQKKAQ
ncbi:hypothetical protein DIPPA_33216 [Diplonema papillatum]|nr:hypothetical protein DIPPA_33216 [Diplonema papillatum]